MTAVFTLIQQVKTYCNLLSLLRWAAHVIRMDTIRTVKKLTEWEPCSSRPVGRPRLKWLEQVEEDLKEMKVRNWREKCKDRRLWNEIVKQAKTHQEL